MIFADGGCV